MTKPERPTRQRQVRLSSAQIDQLIAEYKAGVSTTTLTKLYGVCQETVLKHLRDHGIDTRRQPKIPPEELDEVRSLRTNGWSYKRIEERYGCSWMTVCNVLKTQD